MKRKNKAKIMLIGMTLAVGISSTSFASSYVVQPGDSFWKIGKKYGISMNSIMKANNANEKTIIYAGQTLKIPDGKGTNTQGSRSSLGRKTPKSLIHTVQSGDSIWLMSNKYNVSMASIIAANEGLTENTILQIGQKIIIPISEDSVPVNNNNEDVSGKYGEYLNWFDEVNSLLPVGTTFKVIDFYTGKSFMAKRTMGSLHADCEALTKKDTNAMKEIWGGEFSWVRRPALIQYGDRLIACSVTAMPHAGNDSVKGGEYTTWRSGGYGAGTNLDYIKENGMNGHFDIHFYGSKRHKDGKPDPDHQKCVKIAAGLIK